MLLRSLISISILLFLELCSSQSTTNLQNIETFYPTSSPVSPVTPSPPTLTPPSNPSLLKAVALTAAGTLFLAAVFFFLLQRYCLSPRTRQKQSTNTYPGAPATVGSEFERVDGNVKGLIVDENGLDVLYWRKLEPRSGESGDKVNYVREVLEKKKQSTSVRETEHRHQDYEIVIESDRRRDRSRRREPIQEIPLLREKSSASYDFNRVRPEIEDKHQILAVAGSTARSSSVRAVMTSPELPVMTSLPPPPPPPPLPPVKKSAPPPPPPMPPVKKAPLAPPMLRSTGSTPPPPTPPKLTPAKTREEEAEVNGQVKLKPLHWDKVNTNPEHSMVWNKLDKGSFRFDGDLMEALFGYVATNRASPQHSPNKPPSHATSSSSSSQITLLDPRKSQNIAIVLKSLGISRNALLSSLRQGQGLETETIEKLTRIAPSKDEEKTIVSFAGDPETLADAERFLHRLLKSIPSAFHRLETMQFRSHYESEVVGVKDSIRILKSGCEELRTRGLFMKLLEAILKAGNRMNAGTARGNAQAFHLTALRKLSDVKSTDGKTTLLHFVVEEVVRSEGKRCSLNSNKNDSNSSSKEEKEREYTMLGLPVVGGLSSEFANVKRAAGIDYDAFAGAVAGLSKRVSESQRLVSISESDSTGGGFVREMRGFLVNAHEELEVVGGEQRRVMELVKRTTEYYQAGSSRDRGAAAAPLQLFVIVKDFLAMVDKVCVEIARNSQKKKAPAMATTSSPAVRSTAKFPILPKHFMSDKSGSSSGSDDE